MLDPNASADTPAPVMIVCLGCRFHFSMIVCEEKQLTIGDWHRARLPISTLACVPMAVGLFLSSFQALLLFLLTPLFSEAVFILEPICYGTISALPNQPIEGNPF
jgi:hypothetical protein